MTHETSKKRPAPKIYQKLAEGKKVAKKKKTSETSPTRSSDESEKMNDKSSPSGVSGNDMLDVGDNLGAAVSGLVVDGSVSASTGAVLGEPAQKVVYVRVSVGKHGEWVEVAEGRGVSLSEFVRSCVDPVVDGVLRCQHPLEFRQAYAWSETCLLCGERLRG